MKARKSTVNYNGIEIEVYQLPNGEYHLSKTQVGLAIEKDHKSLGRFIEGTSPEALPYKGFKFTNIEIENTNLKVNGVSLNMAYDFWMYCANRKNLKAQELITKLSELNYELGIKTFGNNFKQHVAFSKISKNKVIRTEEMIQKEFVENYGGLREVLTPVGKIDVLTDKHIIEIKRAKAWKGAVGQLLMYSHYYPNHQKILYLFEINKCVDLELIEYHCGEFNITTIIKQTLHQFFNKCKVIN